MKRNFTSGKKRTCILLFLCFAYLGPSMAWASTDGRVAKNTRNIEAIQEELKTINSTIAELQKTVEELKKNILAIQDSMKK